MIQRSTKFIIFFWGCIFSVQAEYRVYQYYVKPSYPTFREIKPYLVTSTLNPTSYVTYHGGPSSIKVDLVRSWMCKGFTGGGKPICQAPYEKLEQQSQKK